jgi:hypothetical protein
VATRRRSSSGLTFDAVAELASALPGVVRGTSYGTPALKVKGKFLARLKEDGETMALRVSFVVRDHLLKATPAVFYITDHYRDYPAVLVRLDVAERSVVEQLVEDAWRASAPKRLVTEYDARVEKKSRPSQRRSN